MASNDDVPDEVIELLLLLWDGMEEGESVGEVAGGGKGAELDKLGLGEESIMETGFDEVGVDLLQGLDIVALGEEIQRRVMLKELVWKIVASGKNVDNRSGR